MSFCLVGSVILLLRKEPVHHGNGANRRTDQDKCATKTHAGHEVGVFFAAHHV